MTPRKNVALVALCCMLVGVLVLFLSDLLYTDPIGDVVVLDKSDIERLSTLSAYINVGVTSIDDMVSMLTTISLALFVLVGFTTGVNSRNSSARLLQMTFITLFVMTSFISLYLGYAARLQTIELVNAAKPEFGVVQGTLARQALFVSIAAGFAVAAASFSFLMAPDTKHTSSKIKQDGSREKEGASPHA